MLFFGYFQCDSSVNCCLHYIGFRNVRCCGVNVTKGPRADEILHTETEKLVYVSHVYTRQK